MSVPATGSGSLTRMLEACRVPPVVVVTCASNVFGMPSALTLSRT
jgi:hypothetical protein